MHIRRNDKRDFRSFAELNLRWIEELHEVEPCDQYMADHPEQWAVVMGVGPAVGQRVQAQVFAHKADFRSRRLDRTFATLQFVSLTGG